MTPTPDPRKQPSWDTRLGQGEHHIRRQTQWRRSGTSPHHIMTKCHSSVSVPTELVPVLPDEASPVAGVRTVAAAGAKLVEVDQLAVDIEHCTVQISAV